jgi:hypothetical protein
MSQYPPTATLVTDTALENWLIFDCVCGLEMNAWSSAATKINAESPTASPSGKLIAVEAIV